MKVSVAMATYNGEKYIEKQLDSIRKQSVSVDEVIIVDDRSKDDTAEIVNRYIEKYDLNSWKFFVNEQNKGFIGNFFEAIKKCDGDYIVLCDQDDEWEENKIQTMVKTMEEHPKIQALNTAVTLVDGEGAPLPLKKKRGWCNGNILHADIAEDGLVKFDFPYLVKTNISPGCTMCFSKRLKKQFLEYEIECIEAKFPHDWFLNVLASLREGTYFLNTALTRYRMHENNTIGVETEEETGGVEIRSTRSMREEIGEFHWKRAFFIKERLPLSVEQNTFIEQYEKFTKCRYDFLKELSLKKWFKLKLNFIMYRTSIDTKSRISDFIYVLRLDKLLRR